MAYSAVLVEHFRNLRNAGMMRNPDGVGDGEHRDCTDHARFYLRVREGRVAAARFQTYGCGPTVAASSAGTVLAVGQRLEDLAALADGAVETAVGGLPPGRGHAATVVAMALRAAARDAMRGFGRGEQAIG